jgi:hypothetical protein
VEDKGIVGFEGRGEEGDRRVVEEVEGVETEGAKTLFVIMLLDSMDEVGGWERGRLVDVGEGRKEGVAKGEIEGRGDAIFGELNGVEGVKEGVG